MKLFRFELKKLIFNKCSLLFIAVLALFYLGIGIGNSLFSFTGDSSLKEYSKLTEDVSGPLNEEFAAISSGKITELSKLLGNAHQVQRSCSKDNTSKLYFDYYNFATRVNAYYNGSANDDPDAPSGINPLQEKVAQLEANHETDTYLYDKLKTQLDTMTNLGAPEFENVVLWESLFEGWNGIILLILLFFPITFLISSVYTREVSTGMDNLILSSANGRIAIVLAKLGAGAVCSVIITLIYFVATFIGNFLPYMSFEGALASVRSLSFMSGAQFDMSILSFAFLTVLWTLLAALVFGAIVTLISSLLKNHATVFGCGIIVLLLGLILESLGSGIVEKIQLLVDFSFLNTLSISTIFGSASTYNLFGNAVPYWLCAAGIFVILGILTVVALIRQQRHRTIA